MGWRSSRTPRPVLPIIFLRPAVSRVLPNACAVHDSHPAPPPRVVLPLLPPHAHQAIMSPPAISATATPAEKEARKLEYVTALARFNYSRSWVSTNPDAFQALVLETLKHRRPSSGITAQATGIATFDVSEQVCWWTACSSHRARLVREEFARPGPLVHVHAPVYLSWPSCPFLCWSSTGTKTS